MVKKESKKRIIIDGHNFKDMEEFYDEVQRTLCPGFKGFGRNLHAFNDVLRGGFLVFESEEDIILQVKFRNYIIRHMGEGFIIKFERIVENNKNVSLIYSND
jgi:RNAse (barnase) inhibitor barstar